MVIHLLRKLELRLTRSMPKMQAVMEVVSLGSPSNSNLWRQFMFYVVAKQRTSV